MTTARTRHTFEINRVDIGKLFNALPPHAIEAEMSLLGAMIAAGTENVHLIGEVMQVIKDPADFYRPKHAEIYHCLVDLYDLHQSIDLVQLTDRLRSRGQYDAIGGVDYLVELVESVATAINAPHYARIVHDKAKLRRLIDAAGKILHDAHTSSDTPTMVLDRAEKEIFEIAETAEDSKAVHLATLIHETFEALQNRDGNAPTGVPTGYYQLDDMLNGMQSGEMLVLAARPSMGKTALALNICEHVAVVKKQPVLVFSLEMSKQQLAQRLLSSFSGVDSQRMRRNMLSADEFQRLADAAQDLHDAPMYIDDTPGISVLDLRAKARRVFAQCGGLKLIMIDYLQLMSYPESESRVQEVSAISRAVKSLAREMKVPVLCLSQLNRNNEGRESKRPMLSDLRESGSIEQDADVVMMLHREEYYHHDDEWKTSNPDKIGLAELIIAKQRNGPTGTAPLQFDGATTRFNNLTRSPEGF